MKIAPNLKGVLSKVLYGVAGAPTENAIPGIIGRDILLLSWPSDSNYGPLDACRLGPASARSHLESSLVSGSMAKAAAGRKSSFGVVAQITKALSPFITSSEAVSYTTDRSLKATSRELLLSQKYLAILAAMGALSPTWSFVLSALVAALALIASDYH